MYTSIINSATIPNTWAQLDQPTTQELNAETVAESYPTSPLPVVILGAPGNQIWGFSCKRTSCWYTTTAKETLKYNISVQSYYVITLNLYKYTNLRF